MSDNEGQPADGFDPPLPEDEADGVEETSEGADGPAEQPEAANGAQDLPTERSGPLAAIESEEPDLEMPPAEGD